MNIFMTSPCPQQSARWLDDKRVIKMALETAQLLSTAVHMLKPNYSGLDELYAPAYQNHPCSLFTRHSHRNFAWVALHGYDLCDEYFQRFGKEHKSKEVIFHAVKALRPAQASRSAKDNEILDWEFFARPFNLNFNCSGQNTGDIYADYRVCLNQKWLTDKRPPKWTSKTAPPWKVSS